MYNILRGVLVSVAHEDLILLYVLTLLHPRLPHHIREKVAPGPNIHQYKVRLLIYSVAYPD